MSLKDYEFPTKVIPIDASHSFTVRGVDFSDLVALANRHGPALGMIYVKVAEMGGEEGKAKLNPEEIGGLLMTLGAEFPDLLADIIATAAGEPGQKDKVKKLRFPVQVEALYGVIELSVIGEHEVKKLIEIVTKMAEGTTRTVQALTTPTAPLLNGSGAFVSG